MEYTYDAFISYRHLPADMAVAERLQILLEGRKNRDGKRLSVFRDKSDLPTSGDLGNDIREALEHSRFLIIVCSPAYQESKWCMEELRHFRSLHGDTNACVLPVLVEGEPKDAFPALLRFEKREVLGEEGVPTVARVEVEPLGADVRGADDRERKRKLKTEYLRIAAPILGVSFDELYGRAQRRRRAVTALVMAALFAFGVYTSVMIAQITDRQKRLEAKQTELYENESKRLANQSLELVGQDNAKAILLANAALPEDLTEPEYPITDEARLAIQSVALQHQVEEASEPFTLRTCITFDNADWQLGRFYDDGRYMTLYDYERTWLYDTQTGNLIATLPGVEYYFFDGVAKYVREEETLGEDGKISVVYAMFDTATGEELARAETATKEVKEPTKTFPMYDEATGRLWIVDYEYVENESEPHYLAVGWMAETEGFHRADTLPEGVEQACREQGSTSYTDQTYTNSGGLISGECELSSRDVVIPEEYQNLLDALEKAEPGCSPYAASIVAEGEIGLVQLHGYGENVGLATAFWDMERDRLIRIMDGGCFWEGGSGLFFRLMDHELQIWEINPENFGNFREIQPFEYVSADGKTGYMRYYTGERVGDTLGVYHMDDLGDFVCREENAYTTYVTGAGNGLLETPLRYDLYSVAPDGRNLAVVTEDMELWTLDAETKTGTVWNVEGVDRIESLSLSNGGELLACSKEEEDQAWVELYDLEEKKLVERIALQEVPEEDIGVPYVEVGNGKLLIQWGETVLLYDLDDLTREPWQIRTSATQGTLASWESREWRSLHWPTRKAMTKDSLLILTVMNPTAVGSLYQIQGIFDLNTGTEIGYSRLNAGYKEDFYYDTAGGNLILQSNNTFAVERRDETGDFAVVYTITPRHNDMELVTAGHVSDGRWLVLQNDEFCEIYDLADGTLCFLLRKSTHRQSQIAVVDGRLYDFCAGWTGAGIALPDAAQARETALEFLAEGDDRRTLTDQECETYYVPSEWREK